MHLPPPGACISNFWNQFLGLEQCEELFRAAPVVHSEQTLLYQGIIPFYRYELNEQYVLLAGAPERPKILWGQASTPLIGIGFNGILQEVVWLKVVYFQNKILVSKIFQKCNEKIVKISSQNLKKFSKQKKKRQFTLSYYLRAI